MKECLELLGDIIAIYPVPACCVRCGVPFNVVSADVQAGDISLLAGSEFRPFTFSELSKFRGLVLDIYNKGEYSSFDMEDDASAKDTAKRTISGFVHSTKVSAHSYHSFNDLNRFIDSISESEPFYLFLVDNSSNCFVVRGSDASCSVSVSSTVPLSTPQQIDIEVSSVNGLQYIINISDSYFD